MAEKYLRLLGRINDERDVHVGYVVLAVDESKGINNATPRGINELKAIMANGTTIVNATLVNDEIRGTEGDLKRLPIFSTSGALVSTQKITILKEIVNKGVRTGFLVMDALGNQKPLSYQGVVSVINQTGGATNAKIVNKDGKQIVSAIVGTFETIEVSVLKELIPKNLNKIDEKQVETAIKKFRPRKYLHATVENLLSNSIYNYSFPFSTAELLRKCNSGVVKIGSVSDIKGSVARRYNNLLNLEVMCLSKSQKPLTSGEVFGLMLDTPKCSFNDKFKAYVKLKRDYNTLLKTLKEKQALLVDVDGIVARKDAGGYLTSTEFRIYYAVKHNESIESTVGITSIKSRLSKLKSRIESAKKASSDLSKEELLTGDLPFFDEYIRRGKLDFILAHGQDLNCYKEKIKSKADIQKHLDALFIITVASWFAKNKSNMYERYTESMTTQLQKSVDNIYDNELYTQLKMIKSGAYLENSNSL